MNGTAYRILGYAVWHGGKWYARRQLRSRRALLTGALLASTVIGSAAAAAVAKRLAS